MYSMRILGREVCRENAFELLVDHLPDMVHAVGDNGMILYANQASLKLLGYTFDEITKLPVGDIYADDINADVKQGFEDLKKKGFKKGRSTLKTKDGRHVDVFLHSFSVYDEAGDFVQDFSVLRKRD